MDNFEQVIGRLFLAHAKVKAIDRTALSEARRKTRAEQMAALRRAIDDLVSVKFDELTAAAKVNAEQLEKDTLKLSAALSGIKTAIAVLDTISAALGSITSLVKLVKGI